MQITFLKRTFVHESQHPVIVAVLGNMHNGKTNERLIYSREEGFNIVDIKETYGWKMASTDEYIKVKEELDSLGYIHRTHCVLYVEEITEYFQGTPVVGDTQIIKTDYKTKKPYKSVHELFDLIYEESKPKEVVKAEVNYIATKLENLHNLKYLRQSFNGEEVVLPEKMKRFTDYRIVLVTFFKKESK